jgi:Xaa-Pro aminopeptidase
VLAVVIVGALAAPMPSAAQQRTALDEARSQWEFSCAIRKDKFAYVLPAALRRNNVDMWIVLDRGRGSEPMVRDFGPDTSNGNGVFVFTDRGDHIETAALGGETEMIEACGAYDVVGSMRELASFVRERDPQRIALNFLDHDNVMEGLFLADGLSHSDYGFLQRELGEPYASRFVSSRHVIADFRGPRVAAEIVEFSKVADLTRRYLERALSNEVITVGATSQLDISWWLEEQREQLGVERGWFPTVYLHLPDGDEIAASDRVVQQGDVMQIDWGIGRNNFYTDMKRFAYVLRDGETEVPPGIQHAFEVSKTVGDLVRRSVTTGVVGQVQLDRIKQIIGEMGYTYTEDERASDVAGIEVNVGMHAAGNLGHDMTASMFQIYPFRSQYVVRANSIISLEYIVFVPVDEWGGRKVPINVEENALVTEHGIEWIVPPQQRVMVIR